MDSPQPNLSVGFGKHDMTAFIPGLGMMGFGQLHNTVKEVATPLMARACVMSEAHSFTWIHLEQAFVTVALKQEIIRRLETQFPNEGFTERTVLITAQHTHSAPGGYSHYPLYNFTVPNFQTRVVDKVATAAVAAVGDALKDRRSSRLSWGEVSIHPDKEVAFNRSMAPYLNNADAPVLQLEEKHLGVDRRMQALLVHDEAGKLRGHLNWFAVHNTSVSSFNQRIHHDNKGVAAQLFEAAHPGTTAFFAQSSAGDVSPNFRWDRKLRRMVGKYEDQYENAAFNGEIQFREAEKLIADHTVSPVIECYQSYFDMSVLAAAPAHGLGFFKGTLEGPGVPTLGALALKAIARVHKTWHLWRYPEDREFYRQHGNKDILLDHRTGKLAGIPLSVLKRLPPLPDPTVEAVRKTAKAHALETLPWVPQVIPFQLIRLGELLLVALPGEITTHASQRLQQTLRPQVTGLGIEKILVTTYANAYMGYITTPEEYDLQAYEGGHTIYGRHTLDGIIQASLILVEQFRHHAPKETLVPAFQFPTDELQRRSV